jgi:hypothetical protein
MRAPSGNQIEYFLVPAKVSRDAPASAFVQVRPRDEGLL